MIHTPVIGGYITSQFDEKRIYKGKEIIHGGLDISRKEQPCIIYNTHNGIVHIAGWSDSYGNRVWVKVNENLYIVYGHLEKINASVNNGMKINAGFEIGIMGNTGYSFGVHLHYGWSTKPNINGIKLRPLEIEEMLNKKIVSL